MQSISRNMNLALGLYLNGLAHPARDALVVAGQSLTYEDLNSLVAGLAQELKTVQRSGRVGILASRSLAACAGILATCWSGGTYVPLHLKLPEGRLVSLLQQLDLDALIVDSRGVALLTQAVLEVAPARIILSDDASSPPSAPMRDYPRLSLFRASETGKPSEVSEDHTAYIEFTSGTTGVPKGVMVPVGAVNHYLNVTQDWFGFGPEDRAAETCDITFDLSVHNMFMAWLSGAALYVMSPLHMVAPARFIRENRITTWLSVPSIIGMMKQTRTLAPGIFPSLRLSCFCGEPLPAAGARAWAEAAPNSAVENIYGPTEATIACLRQPVSEPVPVTAQRDIVAIGKAYPGMQVAILDDKGRRVSSGTPGEIALSGLQLAKGYFNQPDLTAARFPTIDGVRWYLTGDLGVIDENGIAHHLGRIDNQVKVLGNRVELEEVDMHLRSAAGTDLAAAVAWPLDHGSAGGIIGFVAGNTYPPEETIERLRRLLPAYMVPNKVRVIPEMPLNSNGKIDRKALFAMLENERA